MSTTQQLILPKAAAMISGVWRIQRAHDLVTLEYEDGTREAAKISAAKWHEIQDLPLRIVSEVQSQRVPAQAE